MPPCSRAATKSKKPGQSSIRSRMRGRPKKKRQGCSFIPPARGARRKPIICSPAMGGHGGGCDPDNSWRDTPRRVPNVWAPTTRTPSNTLLKYACWRRNLFARGPGRTREDRRGVEETVAGKRRGNAGLSDQSCRLQRSARFAGKEHAIGRADCRKPCLSRHCDRGRLPGEGKPRRGLDQRPLPPASRGQQTNLLGTTFVSAPRPVHDAAARHRVFSSRFRPAVLSLVAG